MSAPNVISVGQECNPKITSQPAPELTVVIPTYNERGNVAILVSHLRETLDENNWEVVFVDDDSPDGTANAIRTIGEHDKRIRCVRRIGRRGLAGACIEGMLTSQAQYVAVMDADLQHDERLLLSMLDKLRAGDVDLVVATRYLNNKITSGLSAGRHQISRWSNMLARSILGVNLTDPMSGFFMIRRGVFEKLAPNLSTQGFKILLDIATSAPDPLKITELPYTFRNRSHGESKLDSKVALDFALLLYSKITRNIIPYRFWLFCLVGLTGVAVHMVLLQLAIQVANETFLFAQTIATVGAITSNFYLNNALTYRDRRLTRGRFWIGLLEFQIVCAVGAISNVGVASLFYNADRKWWLAGLLGAMIGTVWNYVVSSVLVWRSER